MAILESELQSLIADKVEMRRIVDEQNEIMGFVPDPTVTIERMQQRVADCLRAAGIRPADNDASRAIIAAREDGVWEDN